jgi:hypothetical protein
MRRLITALAAMLACAALLVVSVGLASARAATKFGSDLKNRHGTVIRPATTDPSPCQTDDYYNTFDLSKPCDRVAVRFLATQPGQHRSAPKTGRIKALRLVARFPGSLKFELAKVKGFHTGCGGRRCEGKVRIIHRGPKIHYGSSVDGGGYRIQTFPVHLHVRKGEYLGIKANRESLYSCKKRVVAYDVQQLLFQPVLPVGGPFEPRDSWNGCTLLLQAVYKKG